MSIFGVIRKFLGSLTRPKKHSTDELLKSVGSSLSGIGGLLHEISPIRSRLADQIVDRPSLWFVPVMTTEAYPRLVSCSNPDGSAYHVVVWDERYSHYLARIIEVNEAWRRTPTNFDSTVRACATIAWDFVIEQLCPKNRLFRHADDSARAKRVLACIFADRADVREKDEKILNALIHSQEMDAPGVKQLLRNTVQISRELALDHEAHHYLRQYTNEWNRYSPVSMAEKESHVLDLLSDYDRIVSSGAYPPRRTWSFFETILCQLPLSFLREKFEGTLRGEEIQCDLVPLMLLCNEAKNIKKGYTELQEFKLIATCYKAGCLWQIITAFLQGLRIEVGQVLGRNVRIRNFENDDLGLRLMLGNHMCYRILTSPPYASCSPAPDNIDDAFVRQIEKARQFAEIMAEKRSEGIHGVSQKHRIIFLDDFERSNNLWFQVLNAVGLEVADRLKAAGDSRVPAPPVPSCKCYLDFLGISLR